MDEKGVDPVIAMAARRRGIGVHLPVGIRQESFLEPLVTINMGTIFQTRGAGGRRGASGGDCDGEGRDRRMEGPEAPR